MDMRLPGNRFCPMEDELLLYYLKPKVEGKEVPGKESLICELDLYGDQEPWKIWERFEAERSNDLRKHKDMYFFTQKKKLSAKASRSSRKVGSGTWKGQTRKDIYLLDQDQKATTTLLGSKNTYTYRNKRSAHDGRWIMYELELKGSILPKKRVNKNDYVLCQLRKNDELAEKKRKREQQEEVQEDYVDEDEDGKSNTNSDPAMVVKEPQEKRQRLLPCSSDTYEAAPPFKCHAMPTCCAATETMASGLTPTLMQMGDDAGVDVYGGKLSDLMVGQDWSESHMEDLLNDEQLLSMEVGEWNDLVDLSFLD